MGKKLRVLNVEDSERDMALLARHLKQAGYDIELDRVDTAEAMKAALESCDWDIVLCDYSMPQFNALAALELLKEMKLDIPFIIISGTVGESAAVEGMRSGAQDYLMKGSLARLAPSIERELQEAQNRRARRNAEEKLRLQSAALQAAANAIVITDRNGKIGWVNPAFAQHTGYSFEEVRGKTPRLLKAGKHDRAFYQEMWETILSGKVWRNEVINRHKSGTLIHEDLTITPIPDASGTITHFVGIKQDITERKQAEAALRETEEKLRLFVEHAPAAIAMLDSNMNYIAASNRYISDYGLKESEIAGRSHYEVFADVPERWRAVHRRCLEGAVERNEADPWIRFDGSTEWVRWEIRPWQKSEGAIGGLIIFSEVITERKRAEESLRASELRYRRLFESAKDGILILDTISGQIADANPFVLEMLGYAKEELEGKELWEIGAFKDIVASREAFEKLQERGYIRYENLPLETHDGIIKQVEFVSNSYLEGKIRVIQCNIRDISERKQAEEVLKETTRHLEQTLAELQGKSNELTVMTQQLWQASKLATMGELSASIAHELNNPLATVALRVENLLMTMAPEDQQRHSLEIITQEVDRMADLIENLLQFSRRGHRQVSTVDVREEIANSVEFVHYHLRTRKIEVVQKFGDFISTVQADRQQLRQLFLNLLTNAGDAMPEGGKLFVRAAPARLEGTEAVAIEFEDTGQGIAPENLEKIWEPFFTTKPEGKGTGLGLAICRRIVEEHGGEIELESPTGRGATVRVVFPATTNGSRARLQ